VSEIRSAGSEPAGDASPGGLDAAHLMGKAGRENFPVASWFLPRATRRHLLAIYGFARFADDLGDEAAGDRLGHLDWLQAELEQAFAGTARHPILVRLSPTIRECRLPPEPFLALIEANRVDQRVNRYATFADLRAYCRLSAEPVGRLVLMVTGTFSPARAVWSDDVCAGLQLVEHWQDVAEDAAQDRIYLPREDLARFGVEEAPILEGAATPEFMRLMAFEVDRARGLLAAGAPLAGSLRGRLRLAIAGFAGGGSAALDAIEAAGYDVLRHRTRPSRRHIFTRSLGIVAQARRQRAGEATR
jgi:squalene synthase HpnC